MKIRNMIWFILFFFLSSASVGSQAGDNHKTVLHIKADVVTGFNRLKGNPLWNLGPDLGTFGFETTGAYQPDNHEAAPLNPDTPEDTLLATWVDPVFLSLFDLTPDVVPSEHLNLPLRDVLVAVDPGGIQLASLPSINDVGMLDYSRATSNGDITLKKWLRASGRASLRCNKKSSKVNLALKGLIPNGLYTVTAVFMSAGGPVSVPLGGVPNVFVTNSHGNATYKRKLNFCPGDQSNPGELLIIDVTWHSNHTLYGTQTNLPYAGSFAGVGNHIHLSFLVEGEALPITF